MSFPAPHMVPPPPARATGLATVSALFGVLGLLTICVTFGVVSLVAVIMAHIDLWRTPGPASTAAGAGLGMGYVGVAIGLLLFFANY